MLSANPTADVETRLTFDAAGESLPVWSPDGTRIAFNSNRTGVYNLYAKASNGSGAASQLVDSRNNLVTNDWSRDGRWLLYAERHPTTGARSVGVRYDQT